METTIDIPDPLYRKAEIRAVEQSTSLKDLLLRGLERELGEPLEIPRKASYWDHRKLRPGYAAALRAGAFTGGTDSTLIVSEDRSSREGALL